MKSTNRIFPYFGNKHSIANAVWRRLGDVNQYYEPFFGSGSVLLGRPNSKLQDETVNDLDGFIANFWRATKNDPDSVIKYAYLPSSQLELEARHWWLHEHRATLSKKLRLDPEWCSPKAAGYWLYCMCIMVSMDHMNNERGPWVLNSDGVFIKNSGKGITRSRPAFSMSGVLSHIERGTDPMPVIRKIMHNLSTRLRHVKVLSRDFEKVLEAVVARKGSHIGVFLDPPYDTAQSDSGGGKLYGTHKGNTTSVADRTRLWAIEAGKNKYMHIALCGYTGEHDDDMLKHKWEPMFWSAKSGPLRDMAVKSKMNNKREVIWFSPYCLNPTSLFS